MGSSVPTAVEAEKAIISAMLVDAKSAWLSAVELSPESFHTPLHRQIFAAMSKLMVEDKPVDLTTVVSALKCDVPNIAPILAEMCDIVPSAANAKQYVRMIAEAENRRRILAICHNAAEEARSPSAKSRDIVRNIENEFKSLRVVANGHSTSMQNWLQSKQSEIHSRVQRRGVSYLATGFSEFDWTIDGYRPKDFIVLAARPSVGKTAFALNKMRNMAKDGKNVAMISLEQERGPIYTRLLTAESQVHYQKLRGLNPLNDSEREALDLGISRLNELPITILDPTDFQNRELDTVMAAAVRLHEEKQLDFLVIDHARNFEYPKATKFPNDRMLANQISAATKDLANKLNIPVMMLVHIGRQYEMSSSKSPIPTMADLKDTGKWEEAADIVEILFRLDPEKNKKPTIKIGGVEYEWENMAFDRIAKNRDGHTKIVPLIWRGDFQRFENYEGETHSGKPQSKNPTAAKYAPDPEPEIKPEQQEDDELPF